MSKNNYILLLLLFSSIVVAGKASDPYKDVSSMWNFKDSNELRKQYPLKGDGFTTLGEKLSNEDYKLSILTGGDGYVASFNGKGCLSFSEVEPVFSSEEGSALIRFYPEKSGGIFHTQRLSVVINESGLLIVIVSIKDSKGTLYREIPFSFIQLNNWHNLVLRYKQGFIELILDGIQQGKVTLDGELETIPSGNAFIGKWKIEQVPLPGFPENTINGLTQRIFKGEIDHIAVWNRHLTDHEVSKISGVKSIAILDSIPGYLKCIRDYSDFHTASREMNIQKTTELGLSMRRFMAQDDNRPAYHLTAPMDVIFDPAAAFYYKGQYHVFSYRNLVAFLTATPLAHFVSDDLVHWKDYPIGVWADSPYDVYGIWLGNILIDDKGIPNMLYTALGNEGKYGILAQSYDSLKSFTNKKAVITGMVHHDGHVWKDGDSWFSITTEQFWGKRSGKGDGILLLSSPDMTNWTNQGEIFSAQKIKNPVGIRQEQGFTEFPYLLEFGEKHVLMMGSSPAKYWIGRFDKSIPAFIPDDEEGKVIDHLNPFHCFNPSIIDHKGINSTERRIITAMYPWISGNVDQVPWSGVHVLPRVLSFNGKRLLQEPVSEIEQLRRNHQILKNVLINSNNSPMNSGLSGDALEFIVEFDPPKSSKFGLSIRTDLEGKNGIQIYYDTRTSKFGVKGNYKKSDYPELGEADGHLEPGAKVTMRVFIDHSLFEVFVNGETFTGIYNGNTKNTGIYLFSEHGDVLLSKLDFWQMKSVWP